MACRGALPCYPPAVRILHVTHQFPPETDGGLESAVSGWIRAQQRQGHHPMVLTGSLQPRQPTQVSTETVLGDVPCWRLHRGDLYFDHHAKSWDPDAARLSRWVMRQAKPDLVHVHQWLRLTHNLVELADRNGTPAVVTLHDYYASCPRAFRMRADSDACDRVLGPDSCRDCVPRYGFERPEEIDESIALFRDAMRVELQLARKLIVAVDSTADLVARTLGVPREQFVTVPLGQRPRFAAPLPEPSPGRPFTFAYWGGVARHKGVLELLRAFQKVHGRLGDAVALAVLGGVETPELEAQLKELAAGLPVSFHGPFDSARLAEVQPDCGVFLSRCLETFGIVLDECFSMGRPAVVTHLGALGERAGDAALRVDPADGDAVAHAMERIATDPGLRDQLVAAIPAPGPDPDAVAGQIESIYRDAIQAPRPTVAPVADVRRAAFLALQRETAYQQILGAGLVEPPRFP